MDKVQIDLNKFMGIWYEISRIPYEKQNGLFNCKAEYTMRRDYVSVMNSGIHEDTNRKYTWAAKLKQIPKLNNIFTLQGEDGSTSLYRIVYVSEDYKYSIVSNGVDLMWVLSRDKHIPEIEYNKLMCIAIDFGFDVSKLVYIKQI